MICKLTLSTGNILKREKTFRRVEPVIPNDRTASPPEQAGGKGILEPAPNKNEKSSTSAMCNPRIVFWGNEQRMNF